MKCRRCRAPAVIDVRRHNAGFCAGCFTRHCREQVRRAIEDHDMIHEGEGDTSPVRSVFVIDPKHTVRLTLTYPKSVGRNFDEILRVVDALQTTDRGPFSTPVDWKVGERIVVSPAITTEDARAKFGDVEEVKPYLRYASEPAPVA